MASPADAVINKFLKPIIPLEGILNLHIILEPFPSMLTISPFLTATISIAFPEISSGKSIINSSIGSDLTPLISFMIT